MPRPRKPTQKLKLHGGYRKDRHKDRADEPEFDGTPEKPAGLKGEASALWDRIVEPLAKQHVARSIDATVLQGMCEWWALYRKAQAELDKLKLTPAKTVLDSDRLNEARKLQMIASRAWQYFAAAAAKFGLTPVDRARLNVGEGKESALAKFLKGG
jgi:P27 family predicted phage terminase small subunit